MWFKISVVNMLAKNMLLLSVLLFTIHLCFSEYVGDVCNLDSGIQGTCKLIRQCPSAIAGIKTGKLPITCGFEGSEAIVCCDTQATAHDPDTTKTEAVIVPSLPAVGERSRQKCQEYAKHVFQLVQSPIILQSLPLINVSLCQVHENLIVGGLGARPKQFPHQALLGYGNETEKSWLCGGALISDQFVITAAHCTQSREYGSPKYIRLGDLKPLDTNDNADPQEFNIIEIIRHPQWKLPSRYHDIALLKMDRPVIFNAYIRPICLPYNTTDNFTNLSGFFGSGWAKESPETPFSIGGLLRIYKEKLDQETCTRYYGNTKSIIPNRFWKETEFCTIYKNLVECQIDGATIEVYNKDIYCMYNLIGIQSLTKGCGSENTVEIYTRILPYVDWIEKTVWP